MDATQRRLHNAATAFILNKDLNVEFTLQSIVDEIVAERVSINAPHTSEEEIIAIVADIFSQMVGKTHYNDELLEATEHGYMMRQSKVD